MNIVLLGGFLGSGKTSILLQLAHYIVSHNQDTGCPLAIIENEIGENSIDDKTIQSAGFSVKNLFAGCICCTLANDLIACIENLERTVKPNWIIIEATGLAFPDNIKAEIVKYCNVLTVKTIVVLDAQRWPKLTAAMQPLILGQLRGADLILINKMELVTQNELGKIHIQIEGTEPNIPQVCISAKQGIDDKVWEAVLHV